MTIKEVKDYLGQVYHLDRKVDMILKKADAMRQSLYGRSSNTNSGGQHTGGDTLGKAIAKVVDYERRADEIIDKLIDARIEIERVIKDVPDPVQREVLERRYLLFQPWDGHFDRNTGEYIKGIYEMMNCSRRQMFNCHSEALKTIALNCIDLH